MARITVLTIRTLGRGSYRRTLVDRYGFPRAYLMKRKVVAGFRSGDLVRAVVPPGKYAGSYTGKIVVRNTGSLAIRRGGELVHPGVPFRYCRLLQRGDGYGYEEGQKTGPLRRMIAEEIGQGQGQEGGHNEL